MPRKNSCKGYSPGWCLTLFLIVLGCLQVAAAGATAGAFELNGEAAFVPWSGHWWPTNLGELVLGYRGHPSPIEKYDLYTIGRSSGPATARARQEWYDASAPDWFGFCNGWANAAVLEKLELRPSAIRGIFLEVGDKKGLLSACHYHDITLYERCDTPESFHRYLLYYIGELKDAIVADLDPSGEFWSYPIFRYQMKIVPGQQSDNVTCHIWYADDLGIDPNFEGTVTKERVYTYSLAKDGSGRYIHGGGEWLGNSITDHPEIVWVPVGIDQDKLFIDYATVLEMVTSKGDEVSRDYLAPGHNLVVLDPQQPLTWRIPAFTEGKVSIFVARDPQTPSANHATLIINEAGRAVLRHDLDRNLFRYDFSAGARHSIELVPATGNASGVSIHLYVDFSTAQDRWLYGFPGNSGWYGCAAFAPDNQRVFWEVVGDQGLPVAGADCMLTGNRHQLLMVLPGWKQEDYFSGNRPMAVKIGGVSSTLLLAGNERQFWGTTGGSIADGVSFVVPWLTDKFNVFEQGRLYLYQHSDRANPLTLDYYSNDGTFSSHQEIVLSAEKLQKFYLEGYPGGEWLDGWALLKCCETGLRGGLDISRQTEIRDQLPLLQVASYLYCPHLAVGGGWQTRLTLYNTSAKPANVSLILCVKGGEERDYPIKIKPYAQQLVEIRADMWGGEEALLQSGWLRIETAEKIAGLVSYIRYDRAQASVPLLSSPQLTERYLPHVAFTAGWWTGLVLTNFADEPVNATLRAYDRQGRVLQVVELPLKAREKYCQLAQTPFAEKIRTKIVALRLTDARKQVGALAVYGRWDGLDQISAMVW